MPQPEEVLFDAIADAPDDDAPRLAYADWLESEGDADRAEFIRLQLQRPGRLKLAPTWPPIDRQGQLLKKHGETWLSRYAQSYSGGFIEHLYVSVREYSQHEREWRRMAPTCLAELKPRGLSHDETPAVEADYRALAACASLVGWRHLQSDSRHVDPAGFVALLASPYLTRLQFLDAYKIKLRDSGVQACASAPALSGLSRLILNKVGLGDRGVEALAASAHLRGLTKLVLSSNKIGDAGAAAIAVSPHLANLDWIELSENQIGDAGALALARSPHLGPLKWLYLDNQAQPLGTEARTALLDRFGEAVCLEA
jgi:uncharacterized protein (TIGR02996 family)